MIPYPPQELRSHQPRAGIAWPPQGVAQAWSPADLGALLIAWYDASHAASLTLEDGAIAEWRSRTATSYPLTQTTPALRPTRDSTIGGRAAAGFDGTQYIYRATTPEYAQPYEIWLVYTYTTVVEYVWRNAVDSHGGGRATLGKYGNDTLGYTFQYAGSVVLTAHGLDNNQTGVLRSVWDGMGSSLTLNGVTATGSPGSPAPSTGIVVGASQSLGVGEPTHAGAIGEVIHTHALDSEQAAAMQSYLADKWGVTL